MSYQSIDIPPDWKQLDVEQLHGTVMIVGGMDTGKSTLARYLYQRLSEAGRRVAYLDGDPGQSKLGPPTTMTLALSEPGEKTFPPRGKMRRSFVGSTSPSGHMLPVVTGVARLVKAAQDAGAETILHDTTGLIDPTRGGIYLKLAKIDLLRPSHIIALQRENELEMLLAPLRKSRRTRVIDLAPSPATRQRDFAERQDHRTRQFAQYFEHAQSLTINWQQFAVFPTPYFEREQLIALEDVNGFMLGLGLVEEIYPSCLSPDGKQGNRQLIIRTPLTSLEKVDALRSGSIALDPQTYRERQVSQKDDLTQWI